MEGGLLHDCFVSLLEATVNLKEVQEGEEEEEKEEDEDEENVEEENDDNEDSDIEEREETHEEFLERYAQAAADLEDGLVGEGDLEDQDEQPELGCLFSSIENHRDVALPSQTLASFANAFPQYGSLVTQFR